jgi:glycosyltransferase involved in cell wall biosynthesis
MVGLNRGKNMKKILKINMSKLIIGGMEKALVELLNKSDLTKNYDITLLLVYNGEENYLSSVPKGVKIEILCKGKWNIFNKALVAISLLYRLIKSYFIKYDVSICYTHHHGILSKITRNESKNNIIFIHGDLLNSRTEEQIKKLCNKVKFDKFSKVVCVSERSKGSFLEIYKNYSGKVVVANNYIDGEEVISKSLDDIKKSKLKNIVTFLNVARHEEQSKRITRIIGATERLNKEKYSFRVLLIGDGKDTELYKMIIKDKKIKNIEILGKKSNPFPYYKISDAFIFSSIAEGYGIVLNEARILNVPIITTDVADASIITKEGYGILCNNDENGIYYGMKEFMDKGYQIKNKFDYKKFNDNITKVINDIVKE